MTQYFARHLYVGLKDCANVQIVTTLDQISTRIQFLLHLPKTLLP